MASPSKAANGTPRASAPLVGTWGVRSDTMGPGRSGRSCLEAEASELRGGSRIVLNV